ncbi:hypothetical protein E8E13_004505 [Curvularia kusanoi]|uniref:USP domain-containing protein n=1 Tax=Curvularia kusanoi TaxID=90978 RepID=A0A9P4W6Y8_CURKU|nr:hypothetical protein E8E13_004505 [Curvularia kusanoi]
MDWPCNENDPNRKLPKRQENDPAILNMNQDQILGCVSCRLKAFFTAYWSDRRGDSDSNLSALQYRHPSISPLHALGEKWFCFLAQLPPEFKRRPGQSNADWIAERQAAETPGMRARRLERAKGQHCSDDYLGFILSGVASSIAPDNQARLDQLTALFTIQIHEEVVCADPACAFPRDRSAPANYPDTTLGGFLQTFVHQVASTKLLDILKHSKLGSELNPNLICENLDCQKPGAAITRRIEAAPQYFHIHLSLSTLEPVKRDRKQGETPTAEDLMLGTLTSRKNKKKVGIPSTLDLTDLAYVPIKDASAWPMVYRLISVLYHIGSQTTGGHWVAGVSGPPPPQKRKREGPVEDAAYYLCNDSTITELPKVNRDSPLVQNPQPLTGGNSVVLMYERVNRRPRRLPGNLITSLEHGYYNVGGGAPKVEDGDRDKADHDKEDGDTGDNDKAGGDKGDDNKKDPREGSNNEGDSNFEHG